jgi:hypothetical protein
MADEVVSRIAFTSSMQRPGNNNTDFGTGERDANGEADTIIPIHAIRYCQDNNRRWVLDGLIRVWSKSNLRDQANHYARLPQGIWLTMED